MRASRPPAHVRRVVDRVHRGLGEDVRRLRADAGLSVAALARAAGVDPTYIARLEDGLVDPSMTVYARLVAVLGADLVARLYPNTGPAIRDRHQARILEALLAQLHSRWRPYTEVAVRQPARGWIDLVLHDRASATVVTVEIQSELRRLEQLVRWSTEKAAALPSWEGHGRLGPVATTSRLLVVRSTRSTRDVARQFVRQLETAYPEHPQDALEALAGTRAWPGSALVWADLAADRVRFIARRAAADRPAV